MPRLSSMRSLGALMFPGLVVFLVFALVSASSPVIAQMGDGDASGGAGQQQAANLVNMASTVKRPAGFSSLSGVQALLYDEAVTVAHFDFTKIDYVSLSTYINDVIENAAGQVGSGDSYKIQLRRYQINQLKDDFKSLLSTIQNAVTEKLYADYIDEFYIITYKATDAFNGATILAVPLEGFSEGEQAKVVDALAKGGEATAVFIRFGFAIAVIEHDLALPPVDTADIKAVYVAKTIEKNQLQQALNEANSVNNNAQGNNQGGVMGSSLRADSSTSAMNAARTNAVANNMSQLEGVEIDPSFRAEYQERVEKERENNRLKSRRLVLPAVRKRFAAPASAESSIQLAKALRSANGAAITVATVDFNSILKDLFAESEGSGGAASDAFSGLGKQAQDQSFSVSAFADENPEVAELTDKIAENGVGDAIKTFTLAISLVNKPRMVAFVGLNSAEDATKTADTLKQFLSVVKPLTSSIIANEVQKSSDNAEALDFSPLVNAFFESLEPKAIDDKMTITLDLDVIRSNAFVFAPLLNDPGDQSDVSGGLEDIGWNTEGVEGSGKDSEQGGLDDDDPYLQSEDAGAVEDSATEQDESQDQGDDPFGDGGNEEEDNEDPFA